MKLLLFLSLICLALSLGGTPGTVTFFGFPNITIADLPSLRKPIIKDYDLVKDMADASQIFGQYGCFAYCDTVGRRYWNVTDGGRLIAELDLARYMMSDNPFYGRWTVYQFRVPDKWRLKGTAEQREKASQGILMPHERLSEWLNDSIGNKINKQAQRKYVLAVWALNDSRLGPKIANQEQFDDQDRFRLIDAINSDYFISDQVYYQYFPEFDYLQQLPNPDYPTRVQVNQIVLKQYKVLDILLGRLIKENLIYPDSYYTIQGWLIGELLIRG